MSSRPTKIAIIGAAGHGREVLDVVEASSGASSQCFEFVGFFDEGPVDSDLLAARGASLLTSLAELATVSDRYVVGIGAPSARARFDEACGELGIDAGELIHPLASVGTRVRRGDGLVLCGGSSITTNVHLGRHVHLNRNATIGHDCVVGDYVTLNPGSIVSGNVTLGTGVTIATGAVVLQGLTVGDGTMVGAGAVVTRDLPPGVVAYGSPARPQRPA